MVFLEALQNSSDKEELTALGVHLSSLPVDCRIGKLILLGAMFGVADDALTIAATLSYRSPFLSPISARDEADRAKMKFATAQSDHLTVLNAYKQGKSYLCYVFPVHLSFSRAHSHLYSMFQWMQWGSHDMTFAEKTSLVSRQCKPLQD